MNQKKSLACARPFSTTGAGKGARTLDLNLGKVALYQLSYSRDESIVTPCPMEAPVEAWVGIEPAYTDLQSAA